MFLKSLRVGQTTQTINNKIGQAVSVSGGFSPLDISDCKIWLDFSDSSTITKDGSNRVSQVDDKSGNGYDSVQATGGSQPLWVSADKNGLDVINFASNRNLAQGSAFTAISQPITIFVACVLPEAAGSANYALYDGIDVTNRLSFQGNGLDPPETFYMFAGSVLNSSNDTGNAAWGTTYNLFNGASSLGDVNGTQVLSGDVGSKDLTGLTIASQFNDGNMGLMKIGEIICYDKAVTGTEKASVITYLEEKWGL